LFAKGELAPPTHSLWAGRVHDFWADFHGEPDRIGDETITMGLTVKSESFVPVIPDGNRHLRSQQDSDEGSRAVFEFLHYAGGGVLIVEDTYLIRGAQVQISEHVTSGKAGNQKLFWIVTGRIATKAGIA
jgi:hypothetical protein